MADSYIGQGGEGAYSQGHEGAKVDYRLLVRAAERKRAELREIKERGTQAFLLSMLGIGMAVMFGGLVITFGLLYVLNLLVRFII